MVGALIAVAVMSLTHWFPEDRKAAGRARDIPPVVWQRPAVPAAQLPDRSGVLITELSVTGGGGLVDLRYKVIDPERATELHQAATPPAVVDEKSGLVVHELLMSHSHSGAFKQGVTYYLIFNNAGDWIRRGSRVAVLLGNARVEDVVVK